MNDTDVCACGHVRDEHYDGHGVCEGLVIVESPTDLDDYPCRCPSFEPDESEEP